MPDSQKDQNDRIITVCLDANKDIWKKFGEKAKIKGLTTTKLLNSYMERYLSDDSSLQDVIAASSPVNNSNDETANLICGLSNLRAEIAQIQKLIANKFTDI